jgi:hypothetical protein
LNSLPVGIAAPARGAHLPLGDDAYLIRHQSCAAQGEHCHFGRLQSSSRPSMRRETPQLDLSAPALFAQAAAENVVFSGLSFVTFLNTLSNSSF